MHTYSVDEHFSCVPQWSTNAWNNLWWGAPVILYINTCESIILCGEIPIYNDLYFTLTYPKRPKGMINLFKDLIQIWISIFWHSKRDMQQQTKDFGMTWCFFDEKN